MKTIRTLTKISILLGSVLSATVSCASIQASERIRLDAETSYIKYSPPVRKIPVSVIVLPPTGGENWADRRLAQYLADRGIETLIFDFSQKTADRDDLKSHDALSLSFLKSLNLLIEKNPNDYVVVGASLGGIYGSLALGARYSDLKDELPFLSQIQAGVFVVSGGSIAQILAESDLKDVATKRAYRIKKYNLSNQIEYRHLLEQFVKIDTLKMSSITMRDQVLIFNSSSDTTVPAETQLNLWKAWGEPEIHTTGFSHVYAVGKAYLFNSDLIFKFVKKSADKKSQ